MAHPKNQRREDSELGITEAQLFAEIERLRPTSITFDTLTDKQREFIIKCRDNPRPVTYKDMVKLWNRLGWGEAKPTTLLVWTDKLLKK